MLTLKQIVFIIFLISVLFIVGCTVTEDVETETPTECSPEWICIDDNTKAYQYSNCSITGQKECTLSCNDGACRAAKTCNSGFVCINDDMQAFQKEDCKTTKKKWCDYGCSGNACNPAPENGNVTNTTETNETVEDVEDVVTIDIKQLEIGDEVIITVAETNYNLSVYNIEMDRVRIKVNDAKSDWLVRTGNSTIVGGLEITLQDVLFQSYPGGLKAIEYTIP